MSLIMFVHLTVSVTMAVLRSERLGEHQWATSWDNNRLKTAAQSALHSNLRGAYFYGNASTLMLIHLEDFRLQSKEIPSHIPTAGSGLT